MQVKHQQENNNFSKSKHKKEKKKTIAKNETILWLGVELHTSHK